MDTSMLTGRPKKPLVLTADERRQLASLARRSRSRPWIARRARIVLACAEGRDNQTVARRLRVAPATVGVWRARFVEQRLDGLLDEPRRSEEGRGGEEGRSRGGP